MARLLLASTSSWTRCTPSTSNAQASVSRVTSRPRPPAAQGGDKQAHCVGRTVPIGIHAKPGAAHAVTVLFDRPGVGAGVWRAAGGGQMLPAAVAAAVPLLPPRGAVAVLFLGVDGMTQPVINIGVPRLAQDDALALQRGQRR